MDAYPEDYVAHNLPLVLLSGLGSDAGTNLDSSSEDVHGRAAFEGSGKRIFSDFPNLTDSTAEELLQLLLDEDGSTAPWNARHTAGKTGGVGFRVKKVGRSYTLPPRLANPPSSPTHASTFQSTGDGPSNAPFLYSPLSPLTPGSPTFPDGLMTPLWVTKHQNLVPAVCINFLPLTADPGMSSLRDNQLKIEINSLKKEWVESGYKTRFVVVLLCEDGGFSDDVDERVAGIRRATNLDPKSIFVLPPDPVEAELRQFVKTLFGTLQSPCVEYYRDLSKHARRKRNRGSIPPPTAPPTSGTSQTLSLRGWNVRYEFKLGIFAEFRQEMDAACRNYESAYEGLFGEEVFDSIAGWSPRFNDARLLADTLAIRIIRCLLWTGQTTLATRAWIDHKNRIREIVGRRGKGTNNYGWESWEARWFTLMAQLMTRAELPPFSLPGDADMPGDHQSGLIFVPPEKGIPIGERVPPWEMLHHQGYWYGLSSKHSTLRRALAQQMPEEDRLPPGQSPASQIANKSYLYDTYLAPEPHVEFPLSEQPGFDHSALIVSTLERSIEQFSRRQQIRKTEQMKLELGKEFIQVGKWQQGFDLLRPLWPTLTCRNEGWWELMDEFGWALRECASRIEDTETVLQVDWELLNKAFALRRGWNYDLHRSLEGMPTIKPKPSVLLKDEESVSCVSASFVFGKSEGNVGEPLKSQLSITSRAHSTSAPIFFTEIKVTFEGSLRPIRLMSDRDSDTDDSRNRCELLDVPLRDASASMDSAALQSPTSGSASMVGTADLSLGPSQTKAFNLGLIPREAGSTKMASISLIIDEEKFYFAHVINNHGPKATTWWDKGTKGPIMKRIGKDRDTGSSKILPKPPKIQIKTPNLRDNYYTDERVSLDVHIENGEDEDAEVSVVVKLFGRPESPARLSWVDGESSDSDSDGESEEKPVEGLIQSQRRSIGSLDSSATTDLGVVVSNTTEPLDYEVEISVLYHLLSDTETPISKTTTVDLSFIKPFEATYEFLPRLHTTPWPNFFSVGDKEDAEDTSKEKAAGLQQRWCLNSKMISFAKEPLIIDNVSLKVLAISGAATCEIGPEIVSGPETSRLAPEELRQSDWELNIQKISLEDRRSASLNLALDVRWRREIDEEDSDPDDSTTLPTTTTSTLPIPRFVAPMGEPRVLATATPSESLPGLIHLDYTLENPSMHFLTFNLTMEASEHFAFSGPKATAVQIVPLSRHTIRYNLIASKRGAWIQPQLVVVDSYFNKTLRVHPTEGMGMDKKGILVWVDAE